MIVNPIDKTPFLKAAGPLQDQLAKAARRRGPAEDHPRDEVVTVAGTAARRRRPASRAEEFA